MHPDEAIILLFAAMAAGGLNALAGGGSFISFPTLLLLRIPPVTANATNTVALWPGLAASAAAYFKRLNAPSQLLVPLLLASVAGGWAGAILLLKTPQHIFFKLVPWLLLLGTLLFAFGNSMRSFAGKSAVVDDLRHLSWQSIALSSMAEVAIAIYGGYFGAGIGFMTFAMLTVLGMRDVHAMGAIRILLAAAVNAAAVATFVAVGAVLWPQCAVMIAGSLAGGWFGAHFAQKLKPQTVRTVVISIGLTMSGYFFLKAR